jgi:hypothetical protein
MAKRRHGERRRHHVPGFVNPSTSTSWKQFIVASIVNGTLMGIGFAIGGALFNDYLKKKLKDAERDISANLGVARRW